MGVADGGQETVLTWTEPHKIEDCPVVHSFDWRGRHYLVVVTRETPDPPILAIREADQCFSPEQVEKFFR